MANDNRLSVNERAENQAIDDAIRFFEDHEWQDICRKYAEVTNRIDYEFSLMSQRISRRDTTIVEEDYANGYYYSKYHDALSYCMADKCLYDLGYSRDENGNWIL